MAKVPEQTHSGSENRSKIVAQPSAGTLRSKTNNETATLRSGNIPAAEEVTTVSNDVNKGVCADLASANPDANPKKRTCNSWGIRTPSCKK